MKRETIIVNKTGRVKVRKSAPINSQSASIVHKDKKKEAKKTGNYK